MSGAQTQGLIGMIGGTLCAIAGVVSQLLPAPYNIIAPTIPPIILGWAAWYAPFVIMHFEVKRLTALSKKIQAQLDDFDLTQEDRAQLKDDVQLVNKRIIQLEFQLFPKEIAVKNIERDLASATKVRMKTATVQAIVLREPARKDESPALDTGPSARSLRAESPPAIGSSE